MITTISSLVGTQIRRFAADESGPTAVEYGLIAALIAVGIIVAARSLGTNLSATFENIAQNIANP